LGGFDTGPEDLRLFVQRDLLWTPDLLSSDQENIFEYTDSHHLILLLINFSFTSIIDIIIFIDFLLTDFYFLLGRLKHSFLFRKDSLKN
jgi:hypothetical protein